MIGSVIRKRFAAVLAILSFVPYFLIPAVGLFDWKTFQFMTIPYALLINLAMLNASRMLYLGTWRTRWNEWPW